MKTMDDKEGLTDMGNGVMADFVFANHGSLWFCAPQNDEARSHLEEHTGPEAQWWAGALAVEPRYVPGLVAALQDDGFTCSTGGGGAS